MKRKNLRWVHVVARLFLVAVAIYALVLIISSVKKEQIRQELIAQKIYEIGLTYSIRNGETMIFFMVCEPPNDKQHLSAMIAEFLTEDRLAELRVQSKEFVDRLEQDNYLDRALDGMELIFIEPYEELNIGVFAEPGKIFDYHPEGHSLAIANTSMDEDNFTYSAHILE